MGQDNQVDVTKSKVNRGDIAFDRDRFAADRTIMAWIRTSISLIGFGFSIYKFFEYLKELGLLEGTRVSPEGPKKFGAALVILGVFFLFLATIEYVMFIRRLCKRADQRFAFSSSLLASALLSILGLAVLAGMLFKSVSFF